MRENISIELFSKFTYEDDISSESELFDCQEAMSMLDEARMGKMDAKKVEELFLYDPKET